MENIKIIADKTEEILRGQDAGMAYFTVTTSQMREFNVDNGEFSLFRTLYDNNLDITAYKDQKKGSASINCFEEAAIRDAVETCLKSAESGVADPDYTIAPKQENEVFRQGVYEPDIDRFFERAKELMENIKEQFPKIIVQQMVLSHTKQHSVYRNTNGTEFETFSGKYEVDLGFAGHEGEQTTSLCGSYFSTDSLEKPFIECGSLKKELADAQAQLNTVSLSGKLDGTVILTPSCFADFLYSIVNNFVSDIVILEKTSVWLNKLNEKVADERLTISLAPLDERILCGQRYTMEGFKAENYDLIKNGVLKSFLISQYVANKSGFERAKNTSYSVIIEGGDTPFENMIKNVKNGIIIGDFSGGQPSIGGDFSGVAKNSFLIEDGKIKGAVNEVMISGNFVQLLNDLVAVSKETVADGDKVLPYMAFKNVVIAGK
ncbi:MAG: TldD/PmbA family protein [Lachnospiraceae bacterium]|nr:TldD/PmbA family protein [Lachnospiraceae bacterium]